MNPQSLDGGLSTAVLIVKHALVASGTATFAGVDLKDFIGDCKVILNSTSPVSDGSTTLQIALLHSDDNTTFATWAAAPTFAPITAATGAATVSLDTRATKRYVQGRHIVTGTTATFTHSLILVGQKQVQ